MLAHHVGHEAYDAVGNLTLALELGDARCVKGYYHGVIEEALSKHAQDGEYGIVGLCDPLLDQPEPWDGCVHGLGHGLMWRSGDDLEGAIADCAALPEDRGRQRCVDGALMENSLRYVELPDAQYEPVAPYACADWNLTREACAACSDQVGGVAFLHWHDLERALALCARIDWDAQEEAACEGGARYEASRAGQDE